MVIISYVLDFNSLFQCCSCYTLRSYLGAYRLCLESYSCTEICASVSVYSFMNQKATNFIARRCTLKRFVMVHCNLDTSRHCSGTCTSANILGVALLSALSEREQPIILHHRWLLIRSSTRFEIPLPITQIADCT